MNSSEGRRRRPVFAASCVLFAVVLCLVCAEAVLRWQARRIERSNRLDPGMIEYDSTLGWRLNPGWSGTHRHHDYTVRYHISHRGLRDQATTRTANKGPVIAVLGDSFTFGFGVEDDQTFVSRMNDRMGPDVEVINFGVPGYSTDQEALLLERRVLHFRPELIIVIVYLGNDLIDNLRGFPIQAPRAKPFFTLGAGGLELANVPVPREARPVQNAAAHLARAVLGEDAASNSDRAHTASRFTLWERAAAASGREPDYSRQIAEHQQPSLDLFLALTDRMILSCAEEDARLVLALLPGRSAIERPMSLSAQYQQFVRDEIIRDMADRGLGCIDLVAGLADDRHGASLFYPHDGHLTAEGHRMVAERLVEFCRPLLTEARPAG